MEPAREKGGLATLILGSSFNPHTQKTHQKKESLYYFSMIQQML